MPGAAACFHAYQAGSTVREVLEKCGSLDLRAAEFTDKIEFTPTLITNSLAALKNL